MKIAYFGFAANPPHYGHLEIVEWLAERYDLVLVGPAAAHAFGKILPPLATRMQLCEAWLSYAHMDNIQLTDIEGQLVGDSMVFSYTVLAELRKQYPDATIHLAVGPDNAVPETWTRFYRADDIMREFGRVIAPNMGDDKRSTRIRELLASNAPYEELIELVPRPVIDLLLTMPELYGPR